MNFNDVLGKSMAYQYMPQCESGWYPLIDEALGRMRDVLFEQGWLERAFVRQVKEKFGALRIYCRPEEDDSWPDNVAEAIAKIRVEIEDRSTRICEICGQPGEIGGIGGYHQCLCPAHTAKLLEWIEAGRPDRDWR
jgi:hypothetical protein